MKHPYLIRSSIWILFFFAVSSLLTGCNQGEKNWDNSSNPTNYGRVIPGKDNKLQAKAYGNQIKGVNTHHNTKFILDPGLAEQIASMDGINSAIVALTEDNAYVAIVVDRTATGMMGSNWYEETNNAGTEVGNYSTRGNVTVNPRHLVTGLNSYDTARHHDMLAHNLKQKIAEKVRRFRPHVLEVHISANRQFVNRMTFYMEESWYGHSLKPYLPEFNAIVQHIFARQTKTK